MDKSVDSALNKVTKKLKLFAALKIVKDVAVGASKAIIGYAQDSLDAYAELEKHVASASNVFISDLKSSGKTLADGRDQIEEFTKTLSTKIPYSASEAADALYYLGLTGLDLGSSMDVVDQMMKLSYVDGEDVATTVDLITDAMSNLHMQINRENTTAFMDELTTVMSATNTNAQQALETILNVGSTAQMLGTSRQSLEAMIGILANYGTKSSESGNALNAMLVRMVGNKEALKAYSKLGISMYDRNGNFRGVETVLKETGEVLDKMTEQEKNPIMKQLFGTNYMNEGNILLNAIKETTDELGNSTSEYQQVLEEVMDSGGALEEMYQNMEDTYDAQKKMMDNRIENIKSTLGAALEPAYLEVLKWINQTFFPAAENSIDAIAGIIQENLPNIPGWLNKAKDIIQPVLDGIPGAIKSAYEWGKNLVGALSDYFQGEEWVGLKDSLWDLAQRAIESITNADWKTIFSTVGSIGDAVAGIVSGVGKIAQTLITIWDSPVIVFLRKVIGGVASLIGKFAKFTFGPFGEMLDNIFTPINNWLDSFNTKDEQTGLFNDFADRANEAQEEVDSLTDQIEDYKQQISEEKDPAVIKRMNLRLDELNDKLQQAKDNLQQLTSAANGNLGFNYSVSGTRQATPTETKQYKNKGALPFADGGIVTRPTLSLIGEAGEKEAVIPLSKIGDVVRSVSGGSINYAPVINVTGGGDAEGVKAALSQSYQEFKANYQRMVKENRRLAFNS